MGMDMQKKPGAWRFSKAPIEVLQVERRILDDGFASYGRYVFLVQKLLAREISENNPFGITYYPRKVLQGYLELGPKKFQKLLDTLSAAEGILYKFQKMRIILMSPPLLTYYSSDFLTKIFKNLKKNDPIALSKHIEKLRETFTKIDKKADPIIANILKLGYSLWLATGIP